MLATPSAASSSGTISLSMMRVSSASSCTRLDMARRMIGCASLSALTTRSCSTRSGRSRCTRLTASRTSLAAVSRSVPGLNSTRIRLLFSSLEDRISRTPVTRAAASSKMEVTSLSIVSGAAPGKLAVTDTTGRSISGSSRTSMPNSAARPAITIKRLSTAISSGRLTASMGRSDFSSISAQARRARGRPQNRPLDRS